MTSWWRTERVNEWDETQVLDNKGSLFFTHCGFMDIMLLPTSDQKASAPLLSVVLMMRPPYNQLYSAAAPLFSLVIAHIHQYPISFSWSRSHFISRTPNTLLLFHESNFHCNKTRFVLGSDTSGKTNIAGSLSQRLPWLQSHSLMIGFTLCYRWLHPPDSQRQCDINDSDVPPYRLQAETSKEWWRKKKKITLFMIWTRFPHSHFWEEVPLRRGRHLSWKYMNKSWKGEKHRRTQTGGGQRGQRLTSLARREVSYRLLQGQGRCPLSLSPDHGLCLAGR